MVVGGANSNATAFRSIAIGVNVRISPSASNAVAVSALTWKSCATTEPGSLKLCADNNVTDEGSALVVNGVDVLTKLAALESQVAALKQQMQTSPASVSLVGTLLALSLTAAAVA